MWFKRAVESKYLSHFSSQIGEYFVVGVDIEQYDSNAPDKYLRGLLQVKTDKETVLAYQSYLAIVPSAPVSFGEFARLVGIVFLRGFFRRFWASIFYQTFHRHIYYKATCRF